MNPSKQEVGSPGFTDDVDKRLDRIARLLAVQQTRARSKRMLLSLFQNFAKVKKERSFYVTHVASVTKTRTLAWADGYLVATADAINFYLEKRFSVNGITFEEIEILVDRPTLTELLAHGPRTAAADPDQTPQTNAPGSDVVPDHETDPRNGPDSSPGVWPVGDVQPA